MLGMLIDFDYLRGMSVDVSLVVDLNGGHENRDEKCG